MSSVRGAIASTQSMSREAHREPRRPWLIIAYAAMAPLIVIPLPIGQSIGAADILFPFALIALLGTHYRFPPETRRLTFAVACFGVFVAISALATAWAFLAATNTIVFGSGGPWLIVRMYAVYLPFFVVVLARTVTAEQLRVASTVAMASLAVTVSIGILLFWAGVQVRDQQQRLWGDPAGSTLRAGGLMGNSGDFGHLTAILSSGALAIGFVYLKRHWLSAVALVIGLYGMYAASSRAALLHVLVVLLVMIPGYFGKRTIPVAAIGAPLTIALVALTSAGLDDPGGGTTSSALLRFDVLNLSGNSQFLTSLARTDTWSKTFEQIALHPFAGTGYNMTSTVLQAPGDNSFLTIFADCGLLAGIAFALFWIGLVFAGLRPGAATVAYSPLALVAGEIVHMLTIDTHKMWATTPVSLLLIAIAFRLESKRATGAPRLLT